VVAPLLLAEDSATCDVMIGSYRDGKMGFYKARREIAKLQPDPYFWAPFVVFGYPFPLPKHYGS
jgi:hypothetical protein